MTQHLYLFQIGPVQAFIAQARRTADLYYGSTLLSLLAGAGLEVARKTNGFQAIFPSDPKQKDGASDDVKPKGAPHRFAFICDDTPEEVAKKVKEAIEKEWHEKFSQPVFDYIKREKLGNAGWEEIFELQRDNWLEFYWVAVPYEEKKHAKCFKAASKGIAQRKLLRDFTQVNEEGDKCSVTGSQSVLPLNWDKIRARFPTIWRENEQLGTLMTIKRLIPFANTDLRLLPDEKILSVRNIAADDLDLKDDGKPKVDGKDITKYLAVLHMDGDQMGVKLGTLTEREAHQTFSQKLSIFANEEVPNIMKQEIYRGKTGTLIYSGGDDVFALLPVAKVLECALALRAAFNVTGCTMSAGIAIMPENMPLDLALELSRVAEASAKEDYGRDAVVVMEAHGNGRIRPAGAKWDMIPLIQALVQLFDAQLLSGKLGYDLQALAHDMGGQVPPEARQAEARRLFQRRMAENVAETDKAHMREVCTLLEGFGEVTGWDDMANWVILARFLGQGSREEKQRANT